MIDFFRLLDLPPLPWIDPDVLKERFIALSAIHHPDRKDSLAVNGSPIDYATLNVAYNCLRDVPQRIAHLLELETGRKPALVQNIPEALMNWAFEAGGLLREADQFIAEKARNRSPMIAVRFFEKGMELTERLQAMQGRIQAAISPLNDRLKEMNHRRCETPTSLESGAHAEELGEIYQQTAFLHRWNQQIQERISTLAI